jgi:hypothetical protein
VAAIGSLTAVLPIVLSPIRQLRELPEPEVETPLAHEPGLVSLDGPALP